ncbi:cullin-2 [Patella vulgata]|uniref:cullin-2 n=1 Tax=Patella vulgata TaxID=6465 RepID=UPI0021808766|nr:cullin-2 [Patella vulgata]XP_050388625.1 cullin-2 [Patella vulgata]XP_050388626.1 cullin-2 [Patella vulgata]
MSLRPKKIDFGPVWDVLLVTVKGVITCGSVERRVWNDRFTDVYKLCVSCPEPLGDRLYQETKNFLEDHVTQLNKEVLSNGDESLLTIYHKHWEEYSRGSGYLNQLYGYLNTTFIKKQKYSEADLNYGGFAIDVVDQMLEIGELALDIWKRLMIEPLKSQLLTLLLQDIKRDRTGTSVSHTVIHGVINSFVNVEEYKNKHAMQLYEQLFEIPFLHETGEYYRQEARQLKDTCNCSEYMEKVIQRLDNEDFRSRKFLHPTSYAKVTNECQMRCVADHLQFLHGECREMVQSERRTDLGNMYKLLRPIQSGLGILVQEVEEYIKQISLEVVKTLKADNMPTRFVESMLDIHDKYTELIKNVFSGDQQFVGALDKACAVAINHKSNPKSNCKSPEMLSKYCDSLLKKSSKGISETELDDKLAASITIFKYLDDKDVFQRFYSRMLAKRLIYSQSTSMDAEESLINRLKQACGYEFTNKLHRMFNDITISYELTSIFHDLAKRHEYNLGVSFNIMVLQAGAWPIPQSNLPTFNVPQELEKSVKKFEGFYNDKFSGRKLTWMHNFCTADLKLNYAKKTYFVTMGTFNMAILLMFNDVDKLSFKEIQQFTRLPEKELTKYLQSLLDIKILSAQTPMTAETIFSLNINYNNKRTKFKISTMAQKDSPLEVEMTHQTVDEDRKMYIQAAIVRIMKARKVLKHTLLINEVIKQLVSRFVPNISMIKKCIETLIEKGYLERTADSNDEYSYVA